jgi:hypothetical protein
MLKTASTGIHIKALIYVSFKLYYCLYNKMLKIANYSSKEISIIKNPIRIFRISSGIS